MEENAQGIILRIRPLTETSLIVHWLSGSVGRISTVAKGARRPKSPFLGKLDLFVFADFSFSRSQRSDLHALREVNGVRRFARLSQDLHALSVASYAAAVIEQVSETETPVPELFNLQLDLLEHLDQHPCTPRVVYAFELKLLADQGLDPDMALSDIDPHTRELISTLIDCPWGDLPQVTAPGTVIRSLRAVLDNFLLFQLGRFARGRAEALGES